MFSGGERRVVARNVMPYVGAAGVPRETQDFAKTNNTAFRMNERRKNVCSSLTCFRVAYTGNLSKSTYLNGSSRRRVSDGTDAPPPCT